MNGSGGSEQAGVCVVGGRFMFHFMTRRHERCQRRKPAFAHRTAGKDKLVIMQGSHRFFVVYRYDSCGLFAEGVIPKTAIGVPAAKERFVQRCVSSGVPQRRSAMAPAPVSSLKDSDIVNFGTSDTCAWRVFSSAPSAQCGE